MKRWLIRAALSGTVVMVLLVLLVAVLARASYQSTYRRTYGAFPPFQIEIMVVDQAGAPVPQPMLRVLEAETLQPTDATSFTLGPNGNLAGDAQGHMVLDFGGGAFEAEDWQLFWLFRQIISAPRGLDSYVLEISAPGHSATQVQLLPLLDTQSSSMVPLPKNPTQAIYRYRARVSLP